ncbi:hypothetical protein [Granulicella tundricola]|uniref:Uncharacterized protein n=1 Tax=Granulicella tundricola (strain ATCC BAA-1859 / DSM 23138 / MP5ACTX9) TaxID=1198114 RepID=E8WXL7_GRATM|nr:hypothetical protein [Granulicella tundricola]ADW68633.1 hypothetical protein AciX9_1580 [Granulicella tundricola MP5ACTX9]
MIDEFEYSHGKSAGDLGRESMWFAAHALVAVLVLATVVFIISLTGPSIEASGPKILGTALALLMPMVVGFIMMKVEPNPIAKYVWIAGLVFFSIICVWVLDLPTGNGLCEKCGAAEKLYRTFFDISNGSGLMGGDGLLVGTWIPLSMIGYAIGAKLALDE